MKSVLVQSGYIFNEQSSIWIRPGYAGIAYSDGDEVEQRIASIVNNATDVCVLSDELRQHCRDWPSLYHLSGTRANILRPFEPDLRGDVLEIGAGCGAITRFLGESGGNVLALEGSPRRAAIARARTRDLENVAVVCDKFDDFLCGKRFDVVTLIGVLEYANLFGTGENPTLSMLERARSFLKPNGKLIIAIENQLGLKYFAGALEDHVGIPFYGIEAHYLKDQPQTFGRRELSALITKAGFKTTEFLAPFPDYKLPVSIVTERGFSCDAFDAAALAWQSVRRDPQLPAILGFSPELVWHTVSKNGLALDLANSFLIVASPKENERIVSLTTLAWHCTTDRRRQFCKIAEFTQGNESQITVRYKRLGQTSTNPVVGGLLQHYIPEQVDYRRGKVLSYELMRTVTRDGWRFEDVCAVLREWLNVLATLSAEQNKAIDLSDPLSEMPGGIWDCLPQNIITSSDGGFHAIDNEWSTNERVEVGYIVFRAILALINTVPRYGQSAEIDNTTYIGFISFIMNGLGLFIHDELIDRYVVLELKINAEVTGRFIDKNDVIAWLKNTVLPTSNLNQAVTKRDGQIASLSQAVTERDEQIASLSQAVADLNRVVADRDSQIASLELACSKASNSVEEVLNSTSWKLTTPVRALGHQIKRARHLIRLAPQVYRHCGGAIGTTKRFVAVIRCDGMDGIRKRLSWLATHPRNRPGASSRAQIMKASDIDVPYSAGMDFVPYYLNENHQISPANIKRTIGVHLHLYYQDMLDVCISYLNNIKTPFDLYVSVSDKSDTTSIAQAFRRGIDHLGNVEVECVPNRGRDIAPMIVQFGQRLLGYDLVLHIQTKKSPHLSITETWLSEILNALLGSPNSNGWEVKEILYLLSNDAKIIYPEPNNNIILDRTAWSDNYTLAKDLLEKYSEYRIEDFPMVEFPQGSMFWARSDAVRTLLSLPLTYEDFPVELPPDGTIAHALERLILVFTSDVQGRCYRLHNRDSIPDFREYEAQVDFSNSASSSSVKVLSYYLPQFHPIPENDEWHGKGFTEWTKVRAANPLFRGHYQQHIPHPDIGYYFLDTPETLRKQANLMRKSGVYGQVFYHYWFTGKLILDEPARMLLANPDIAMPFCFCWANENWTRRWDGNESEILLGQNYSAEDARQFIRYLIPFFHDNRHIQLDNRPVLFVYRPSSIPDIRQYLDIWAEECLANGLQVPYVVAVLTRGATHPAEFGMDAGVERVLHDWTAGGAPEIKADLDPYAPINGSVLSYDDVASFYTAQKAPKDFTYFRSLVPIWDNTARYGSEAFVVHGSTPECFQNWLESAIQFTEQTLPADRRFVVVNAWNEWAEGAHLEPDTRFGYAYLNSVGRALLGIPYANRLGDAIAIPAGTRVHFNFPQYIRQALADDKGLARRFFHTLARSSVFGKCDITVSDSEYLHWMPPVRVGGGGDAAYRLDFCRMSFFSPYAIERMLQTALRHPESIVISNTYDGDRPLVDVTSNGSVHGYHAHDAALVMFPKALPVGGFKNFRLRTDAQCFVAYPNATPEASLPVVTTIIRFHKTGDLELLRNALCCLVAMRECLVRPLIAAQDLADSQVSALNRLLDDFSWPARATPVVHQYYSPDGRGDLRSKMLNESLRRVDTQYTAFLDYDDLMMSHAYAWLVGRLRETGKAVAFGRVYCTAYDYVSGHLIERTKEYKYGNGYDDFIYNNHAPLHSFMMDVSKLNIENTFFHEDQRYMEDYFLTLQLFRRDNCDWESLSQNCYIGDYIHSIDRAHTLAFSSDSRDADRQALLENPEYRLCEQRVNDLRGTLS